jgi:3-isopropylmalate/(R)-2-methylmalate dehydratase small subunit
MLGTYSESDQEESMTLAKIERVVGRAVHVPGEDIDTDRIIPARYLKCVTFDGLGEHLFKDVRFREDGTPTGHPLDDPRFAGATILVAGRNFGCGSSREHAPQSIAKFGFRAIVAESFAEIFFGNSVALGIPCVSLARRDLDALAERIEKQPETVVAVDLAKGVVEAGGDRSFPFSMKPGAREALRNGLWDPIGQLLEGKDQIRAVLASLPYTGH